MHNQAVFEVWSLPIRVPASGFSKRTAVSLSIFFQKTSSSSGCLGGFSLFFSQKIPRGLQFLEVHHFNSLITKRRGPRQTRLKR